eukprot:6202867-Pleurochrysis_carterae.AAC.8
MKLATKVAAAFIAAAAATTTATATASTTATATAAASGAIACVLGLSEKPLRPDHEESLVLCPAPRHHARLHADARQRAHELLRVVLVHAEQVENAARREHPADTWEQPVEDEPAARPAGPRGADAAARRRLVELRLRGGHVGRVEDEHVYA